MRFNEAHKQQGYLGSATYMPEVPSSQKRKTNWYTQKYSTTDWAQLVISCYITWSRLTSADFLVSVISYPHDYIYYCSCTTVLYSLHERSFPHQKSSMSRRLGDMAGKQLATQGLYFLDLVYHLESTRIQSSGRYKIFQRHAEAQICNHSFVCKVITFALFCGSCVWPLL